MNKMFVGIQTLLQEAEKNGKAWKVFLIEEGLSKNGKYYPAEVLKKAVGLFDKAKAYFYEWKDGEFNHMPDAVQRMRPEGFPRQIAGWYSDPKFEEIEIEGQKRRGITATLNIHDGAKWLKEMLKDAWMNGMRKFLGLSIDADGAVADGSVNGTPMLIVTAIKRVFGVDLVTNPAAGGQLIRLVASQNLLEGGNMDRAQIIEMIKKLRPELLEGVNVEEIKDEELKIILEKAMKAQDDNKDDEKKKREELDARAKKVGLPAGSSEADIVKKEKELEEKNKKDADAKDKGEAEKNVDEATKAAKAKAEKEGKSQEEMKKIEEAAKGEATIAQVVNLLKEKKTSVALEMLQTWMEQATKKDGSFPFKSQVDDILKKFGQLDEKIAITECSRVLDDMLKESKLPAPIKKKIEKRFKGKKFEKAELETSLQEEIDTMAELTSEGDVDIDGEPDIRIGKSEPEKLRAAAQLMVDPNIDDDEKEQFEGIKGFKSLREAYVRITGDVNISGIIPQNRLREATTSDFSYILGTSIYRKMAKEYKMVPAMWKDLADVVNVKDFKTQEIIRWGGFANLEAFTESDDSSTTGDYSNIAFPGDEEATYSASTRGGIVKITRKMIINDDLRAIQKLPTKLARAAVRTLNQFVFDLLLNFSTTINGGTIYDSLALYHANHFNYTTDALDYDSYGDALDRLREQKEFGYKADLADSPLNSTDVDLDLDSSTIAANFKVGDYLKIDAEFLGPVTVVSGTNLTVTARGIWGSTAAQHLVDADVCVVTDDLMLDAAFLWIPTDLRTMGQAIIEDEYETDTLSNRNKYKGTAKLKVVPRKYMRGDLNNWFITAPKSDVELIEIGFLGGKQNPELLRQDAPGVGLVFNKDLIRYKVRHEYGGAVVDYRGFQGAIVA